mmetsp:Transcript_14717/g.21017  ORF Transcript_14717/g.21017 Transcript_14717/m.21017 type:complete len:228 (+) Transcript_14717:83-766(+)
MVDAKDSELPPKSAGTEFVTHTQSSKEATETSFSMDSLKKSALQENIELKGKNAYYFAHAHKATGPKWDGKPQPRLLSKSISIDSSTDNLSVDSINFDSSMPSISKQSRSFDYNKSTITKYAFLDEGKKIKIYVSLEGVGERCNENEDISLEYDSYSFSLSVKKYHVDEPNKIECLTFGRLYGLIDRATFRLKSDKIIITLMKKLDETGVEKPDPWPGISANKIDTV